MLMKSCADSFQLSSHLSQLHLSFWEAFRCFFLKLLQPPLELLLLGQYIIMFGLLDLSNALSQPKKPAFIVQLSVLFSLHINNNLMLLC